jgi:hypothetical protein
VSYSLSSLRFLGIGFVFTATRCSGYWEREAVGEIAVDGRMHERVMAAVDSCGHRGQDHYGNSCTSPPQTGSMVLVRYFEYNLQVIAHCPWFLLLLQ